MNIKIFKNSDEASQAVFELYKNKKEEGATVFGLATGSTPEKLYQLMSDSDLDFSESTSINLDEYVGLGSEHPQSYAYFMNQHLFRHKPFKESHLPNGLAKDLDQETRRYDEVIANNPIDLQLLGLGSNGHIGFNEPGSSFDSQTQHVQLTESTISDNQRFFSSEEEVPKEAISMGIASILSAKEIVIMAFGLNKAKAVKEMIQGPMTEAIPASALQQHRKVHVFLDEKAASLLD
ncbi:glucosamine-6-phosphate deaminase [Facklamia sp. DSM 111018]|uniref:Glucosamine-6-phosphate deaminase n=1 Tax=Facklamia lactis TaxID=2749967 RepID=A0ABS0LT12_9LACT|nr:glucosamine-6-phosphate deaminase [Facklamia lactis]MBG9980781.1 glucosamine-6-phosphate deaminase [Facklamia lactis]MBG9986595.1 glucosamine-6-phosphate deaminase [Facklamia lactis]